MQKIAVICDKGGKTSTIFDCDCVKVFLQEDGIWRPSGSYPVNIDTGKGMGSVRESISELIDALGDVVAVVGREISGVPYHLFDTAGLAVFELSGSPQEFLDYVSKETLQEKGTKNSTISYPDHPLPAGEGKYKMNLIELQQMRPDISSKKALMPFFENTIFYELEVTCSHIPPWFDRNFPGMKLKYEAAKLDASYKVTIFHDCGR